MESRTETNVDLRQEESHFSWHQQEKVSVDKCNPSDLTGSQGTHIWGLIFPLYGSSGGISGPATSLRPTQHEGCV